MISSKQTHMEYALFSGVSFAPWVECVGVGSSSLPPLLAFLLSTGPASVLYQFLIFFVLGIRVIRLPYLTHCWEKTRE